MLNLAEYRKKPQALADFLPWAALVAPCVIANKDGSFQRSARFRGPDLDSATPAELVSTTARLNGALRRLGSGWAVFVEAQRVPANRYPRSRFPDAASALVEMERRFQFEEEGAHFESTYFLTLCWLPPVDAADRAEGWLYENRAATQADGRAALAGFIDRTDRVLALLDGFMPEAAWLSDEETLTYLHSTVSTRRHSVRVPETPMHLDAILVDEPLSGGLEPRLGTAHLRTLTVLGFPSRTSPGLLDDLNRLAFPYRWCVRAVAMDKTDATKVLTRIRRQWFAKRKSIAAIVKEVMTNESSVLMDSDAANKAADADMALQELGSDLIGEAYVTATVTVWDKDARAADERLRLVEKTIQGRDFTCIREGVNAVEAWLGSLPGQLYANVRQPPISTLNLAHMMPFSAVWAGPARDGANSIAASARAVARRAHDRERATHARRERGSVPRDVYLAEAQMRRVAACRLRDMGIAIDEIARRLSASLRSVHRWIAQLRSLPGPSRLSDFKPRSSQSKSSNLLSQVVCEDETPDLLVYARQRLSRSTREGRQKEPLGLRGDRDAAATNRAREEVARGMGPRTAPIYDTVLSRIQRRISEIRSGTSRRGPP